MKIICSKDNLIEGINIVQKAVSSRTPIPILEGILLEADDKLKLTGNDLEIGIEFFVEADVQDKGSIVINARILGEIVKKLPDAEVMLEVKDNNILLIECDSSHFEINGFSSSGFPSIPEIKDRIKKENVFKISQELIRDMVRKTIFAVSLDENRPTLTGSLMECKNSELSFVACDSFRVAVRKSSIERENADMNVIIPGKTLGEIVRILQPVDEEMVIYITGNQILFDIGKCKMISRLIEGEYFKYRSFIPEEYETKIKLNTRELLSSIERASLIITSEERRYPVRFNISEDKVVITSNTEIGAVREEIRGSMEGNDIEIGFNPRYFVEALRVIEEEQIEVCFSSGICTMRPVGKDSFVYLIVPLRK